ncbi:hypothetical protein JW905_19700 [bacterium]|nr:hypothetical protein [candidate division CSSED10-310 bacterium]
MAHGMDLDLSKIRWEDHPRNPLIEPPRPEWMIADPSVLPPKKTRDGLWHLFANSIGFINHYVSRDGITWEKLGARCFQGIRPFLYTEGGQYYLFYERFRRPWRSGIVVRRSLDLVDWSAPVEVLEAARETDGGFPRFLGNPCLVKDEPAGYRLYFSGGWVFLKDCLYFEPRHIGVASASAVLGPYDRHPSWLLSPDSGREHHSLGAGAIKIIRRPSTWWIFNNGIFRDHQGRSRSAIMLYESHDGLCLAPDRGTLVVTPGAGWKRAFVYACAPVLHDGMIYLYYNARDGWFRGRERIGLAIGRMPRGGDLLEEPTPVVEPCVKPLSKPAVEQSTP